MYIFYILTYAYQLTYRNYFKDDNMGILNLNTRNEVNSYFDDLDIRKINAIAIDIECEMNLHCYGEHLCLIQIYDNENAILIDPMAFNDKNELNIVLKTVFEKRNMLKITYDSAGDASILEKIYGIKFKSILDLKPAVELLGYEKQSLSHVLSKVLSLPLKPKKKFQTYNWMKRPINPEALEYAIADVTYLFDLKEKLIGKIVENGLLEKYMLMNLMAQNKEYVKPGAEEIYAKRKGYSKLSKIAKNRYKLFYNLREIYAEKTNKSPNSLLGNIDLLPLANKKVDPYRFLERKISYRMNKEIREEFKQKLLEIY